MALCSDSSLVVLKLFQFDQDTNSTVLSNSGGPDHKRSMMNNERKFYRLWSGVYWLITMCKDIGALTPSAEGRSTAEASLKML